MTNKEKYDFFEEQLQDSNCTIAQADECFNKILRKENANGFPGLKLVALFNMNYEKYTEYKEVYLKYVFSPEQAYYESGKDHTLIQEIKELIERQKAYLKAGVTGSDLNVANALIVNGENLLTLIFHEKTTIGLIDRLKRIVHNGDLKKYFKVVEIKK